ncbi:MAG TPA: NAD-dependent epimerase/dehydratase family protein [Gemmatimonadales bacterium]|nr:NAD-dependent epimerase/dehydratase family protein [Gemmatimonadales bacterium]
MTVLVTGGSGLVGSHVITALVARGDSVRALVRPAARPAVSALGATVVEGDVTDPAAWARAATGARAIVHAAALVAPNVPLETFLAVNVGGTRHGLATARATGARLVHVSSVAVYGRTAGDGASRASVTEDFPFQKIWERDYYAQSKRRAEELLWEEVARGGIAAVVVRPNVIYGEYDRLFSPRVLRAVRGGFVPQIGPGTNRLSCVYAGNVAAAIVLALNAPAAPGRAYNTTDDGPDAFTQRAFVDAFARALGARVRRVRVSYGVARFAADALARWQMLLRPGRYPGIGGSAVRFLAGENPFVAERARRELGWRPVVEPREAVRRTVAWLERGR